jgi:hypothetical protein
MKRCHIKAQTYLFKNGTEKTLIEIPVTFPVDLTNSVAAYCYEKTSGCTLEQLEFSRLVPIPKNKSEVVETLAGYFKTYGQIYDSDRFRDLGADWETFPHVQKIKTAITKLFGF